MKFFLKKNSDYIKSKEGFILFTILILIMPFWNISYLLMISLKFISFDAKYMLY